VIEIREYLSAEGHSPFRRWFDRLDARAAARITVALVRIEQGNLANAKSVAMEC
jgi:putative component of toxin-antitoxin plasmid stabilization module